MPVAMPRSSLVGADLVWLLSVDYAGRTFRWASRPCAPVDEDGNPLPHDGGLDPVELEEVLAGASGDPDLGSLPFEVLFPEGVSVAALVGQGHDLAAATGEVSLWAWGTAWEARRLVLRGRVSAPEWGDSDEPVSFSVEEFPWEDSALVPSSTARVTETTWPNAVDGAAGLYYPVVFGAPGVHAGGICPGSPGLFVRFEALSKYILLAGHEVSATSVTLQDPDGAREVFAVQHVRDGLNRLVAVVDIYGASTVNVLLDGQWWVIWDQGGGGLRDGTRTGTLSGAGDVLVHFLGLSTLTVDAGRWAAVRAPLNSYSLAGYLDDPCSPWEWLTDNVLPLLPVAVRSGPSGCYPVLLRHDATAAEAVEHLVAGPGVVRTSFVSTERAAEIVNEIRMEYAIDPTSGDAQRWRVVSGDADPDSPEEIVSYWARISLARYGVHARVIESDVVWSDQTAGMVCAWKVAAYGAPSRRVTYNVDQTFGWLEVGSIVTLTDSSLAYDAQVSIVSGIRWVDEVSIELTLTIIEALPRDRRA